MPNEKKVRFPVPADFSIPEGTETGGTFDAVCTFRLEKDNQVCLTVMGDAKMPGYDEKGEPRAKKQDYSGYVQSMNSMRSTMMENNNNAGSSY